MTNKKPSSQLNISDFESRPLWTWEDDDDTVIPINMDKTISNEFNAIFARCTITLHDGTKIIGVIAVRMSNHEVYLISFPHENGKLLDIPLQPLLSAQKELQLKKLCGHFDKELASIFPLEFETPFKFSDGTLLNGKIDP